MKTNTIKSASLAAAVLLACQSFTFADKKEDSSPNPQNTNAAKTESNPTAERPSNSAPANTPAKTNTNDAQPASALISPATGEHADTAPTPGTTIGQASSLMTRGKMSEKDFDAHFVFEAAEGNMTEIAIGKAAEQKAEDPQVKQFAAMLVHDHEMAASELKQAATAKGIVLPAQLDEVGQSKVNAAARMSAGPDFDRHFVYCQVGDHKTDVLMYRAGAHLLTDPQLKQWAQEKIPTLKQHLHMAEMLAGMDEPMNASEHHHTGAGNQHETGASTGTGTSSETPSGTSGVNK